MNVYRVTSEHEIGSRYLQQCVDRGGYVSVVEEIARPSGDYQEMVPASELTATREALVKADERAMSNLTLAYASQNKTAKVLDTVRDYIIDSGEGSFPDGFVDAMVKLGMEPMVGTRELTITFAVSRKFMVTLDNVPASLDDDDLVRWLSRIDVDGDESTRDINNRITQELRMEDQDDIEISVCDDGATDDFEVEMA